MRKERDLNPRYPLGVCVLSRDVLSATQPSFLENPAKLADEDIVTVNSIFRKHSLQDRQDKGQKQDRQDR